MRPDRIRGLIGDRAQSGRRTFCAVAPYAAWMVLMMSLPATAAAYAVRTAVSAALLAFGFFSAGGVAIDKRRAAGRLCWGLAAGLAVFVLWVFPERFPVYRDFSLLGALGLAPAPAAEPAASPYDPNVCGVWLATVRLAGSAFVIAPAEELFFRLFLYRWLQKREWTEIKPGVFDMSAFVWTAALFSLEHHTRLAAGLVAGVAYGALAVKKGVPCAIVAHIATNLALGVYVVKTGQWGLW